MVGRPSPLGCSSLLPPASPAPVGCRPSTTCDPMSLTLLIHISAGTLGLLSGYTALYSVKGETLHRRAGIAFVSAMLVMCFAGMLIAATKSVAPAINIPAAVLTAYLVVTGFAAVRPPRARVTRFEGGSLLISLGIGLVSLKFGFEAIASGGTRNGIPAFPFFMFGVVGLLAAAGDVQVIRSGRPLGTRRLSRHLWRMSFALFIAAMSFFLGQASVIPEPLRKPVVLASPVLAVLVTMFYYLWRVRSRRGRAVMVAPDSARVDTGAPDLRPGVLA